MNALVRILALLAGLAFLALMALGIAAQLAIVPDTAVRRGDELNGRILSAIAEHRELEEGEAVDFFYSAGFLSYAEDGNAVTGEGLLSWGRTGEGGGIETFWAPWEDIVSCTLEEEGGTLDDALLLVQTHPDYEYDFYLLLSTEDDVHLEAIALIEERIEERGWRGTFDVFDAVTPEEVGEDPDGR